MDTMTLPPPIIAPLQRFADQPLGDGPTLVVLGAAKIGNYVVLQPLLRGLREKYPQARLVYVGSLRTAELERLNPWIDEALPLAERGAGATQALVAWRAAQPAGVDLVINADGHSAHTHDWVIALAPRYVVGRAPLAGGELPLQRLALDPDWNSADLVRRYAGWITSNSIRELQCRVAWVRTDYERVELPRQVPPVGLPQVLLAVNGERSAKLWSLDHWLALLARMGQELDLGVDQFGLIGGPPGPDPGTGGRIEAALVAWGVSDLRARLSLPELVGAMAASRLVLCVDSGPMHLAAAAGCPTVVIFGTDRAGVGASPRELWAPRSRRVHLASTPISCGGCRDLAYSNDHCPFEDHPCQRQLDPTLVWPLVVGAWRQGQPSSKA